MNATIEVESESVAKGLDTKSKIAVVQMQDPFPTTDEERIQLLEEYIVDFSSGNKERLTKKMAARLRELKLLAAGVKAAKRSDKTLSEYDEEMLVSAYRQIATELAELRDKAKLLLLGLGLSTHELDEVIEFAAVVGNVGDFFEKSFDRALAEIAACEERMYRSEAFDATIKDSNRESKSAEPTITTTEMRSLVLAFMRGSNPRARLGKSTARGWTSAEGFPAPIGNGKSKTYPRDAVLTWLRVNKGYNIR